MVFKSNIKLQQFYFRATIILFILTGSFINSFARIPELSFRYFTKNDGLESSNISEIVQDSLGFLWIATLNGLNKYDGSTFYTYHSNSNDSLSLPSNHISKFLLDSKGKLWIATHSGLCTYNENKNHFDRISSIGMVNGLPSNDFVDIVEDNLGNIIVLVEDRVYQYQKESSIFTYLFSTKKGIGNCLLTDNQNNIWVGTNEAGIVKYNVLNKKIKYYSVNESENSLSHNSVIDLAVWNNKLWIATMGGGINSMNFSNEEFEKHNVNNPDEAFSFKLYIDNQNNLWSLDYAGLRIFDEETNNFFGYYPIANDPYSIKPSVKGIIQDNNNNYWIYNEPGGLAISTARFGFKHFDANSNNYWHTSNSKISAVHEDRFGNLWIGNASSGIDVFYWQKGVVHTFMPDPENPHSLGNGAVKCIYRDVENKIWISTYHTGLQYYNEQTNQFISYPHNPYDPTSTAGNDIRSIKETSDGKLILTVHGKGLDIMDIKTGKFKHYNKEKNKLSNDWTFDALEDSKSNIWVASSWGLSVLKNGENEFDYYYHIQEDTTTISDSYVLCLLEDSKGNIWAGTKNGLNLFNRSTNSFIRFGDKLDSDYICSIQEDHIGNIWVSTLEGISKINPTTNRVDNFGAKEGIRSGEFFPRSIYKNLNHELFFGGSMGIELLNPKEILNKSENHRITINSLKLFNKEISFISNPEILSTHIAFANVVKLDHDQNYISLSYNSINLVNSEKDAYAYKLEGFDKEWNHVANKREAVYTNLDPGNYTFYVKALNNDHVWSQKPASLKIIISPPWYGTLLFKLLMAAALIGLVFFIIYLKTRQLNYQKVVLKQNVDEKTKELLTKNIQLNEKTESLKEANNLLVIRQKKLEQQSEEIKAQSENLEVTIQQLHSSNATKDKLFSIIAHDLLSPFNAILGFSELLVNDFSVLSDKEKLEDSKIINQSSVKVFGLLQNLLFWARSQTKGIKAHPEIINMIMVIEDTLKLQKEVYLNKNIRLNTNFGEEVKVFADLEMVKTILRNLVSNAIKFSPVGSSIEITLKKDSNRKWAKVIISDSGPGLDTTTIDNILNSKPITPGVGSNGEKGSGLGLTVCNDFLVANGGLLTIESSKEKGSDFIISLPLESVNKG